MIDLKFPNFNNTPVSALRPLHQFTKPSVLPPSVVRAVIFFNGNVDDLQNTIESLNRQTYISWAATIIAPDESLSSIDFLGLPVQITRSVGQISENYLLPLACGDLLETTAIEKMLWCLETNSNQSFCLALSVKFGKINSVEEIYEDFRTFPLAKAKVVSGALFRTEVAPLQQLSETTISCTTASYEIFTDLTNNAKYGIGLAEHLVWEKCNSAVNQSSDSNKWQLFENNYQEHLAQLDSKLQGSIANDWTEIPYPNNLQKKSQSLLMFTCPLEIGGSTKFNKDLVEHLTKLNWAVSIVVTDPQQQTWMSVFSKLTPDIFVLPKFLAMADHLRFIYYLIESRKPETVLITHAMFGYDILPLLKARYPQIAFVDYTHVHREYFGEGGYAKVSASWQNLLDLSIVSSEQLKTYFVDLGADAKKIEVAYTNIDTDKVKPCADSRRNIRNELQIENSIPVILFAGRFEEQKQPPVLLKALHKLKSEYQQDFVALLAGDGDYKEWMLEYVTDNELSQQIWFMGKLANEMTIKLMKACDIFFLPSRWEGISLAFYEAMASGLVVVGSNVGGQKELVTPECGTLLDTADEETEVNNYAAELARLISQPALIKQMQVSARKRVENHFQLSQMGQRMQELLLNVAKSQYDNSNFHPSNADCHSYYSLIMATEFSGNAGHRAISHAHKLGAKLKAAQKEAEILNANYLSLKNEVEALQAK